MQPAESVVASDAHAKAILEAFGSPLASAYSKVQKLQGTNAVTDALMQIFPCLKVSQVEPGWTQLASRIQHIAFLVTIATRYPEAHESFEEVCEMRKDELAKLANDVNQAAKQGKLQEFLNASSFVAMLDRVIRELTGAISSETTQTKVKLKQAFDDEVSAITADVTKTGQGLVGVTLRMTNNEIGDVEGDFDSGNVTYDDKTIARDLRGNKIGRVKGAMFANNKAGLSTTPGPGPQNVVKAGIIVTPPPYYGVSEGHEDTQ